MIAVSELQKCTSKDILRKLVVLLAPFAPHIAEELWESLGQQDSVCNAQWPVCEEKYLVESTVNYTISFNGKARFNMEFSVDENQDVIREKVLADERSTKWIEGKKILKVIIVPKKIVNIVVK